MTKQTTKPKKKPSGPKPELISLYPFTFEEVLDTVLASKPKKARKGQEKEVSGESSTKNKD
jgi:hypothetical protein